jgi:glycerophosphoryl diester phosphodiesterase
MTQPVYLNSEIPFLRNERPLIMAHRGRSAFTPESSYQSFKEAYELEVDVLETDIRLTKDNIPVVFHDKTLERTTNGVGPVNDFTFEELQQFDLGYWYQDSVSGEFPYRNKDFKILSLVDFFEKFPKIRVNLDIKDKLKVASMKILEAITSSNAQHRVLVGSFRQIQIKNFRAISANLDIPTSACPIEVLAFLFHFSIFSRRFCALQVPMNLRFLNIVTQKNIQRAHKRDLAVHPWTINESQTMADLFEWGIDGIFSDDPELLLKEWNSHKSK